MYVIVTYDIGVKRVSKVLRICRKYLVHVQKSVFEGQISPAKFRKLCSELEAVIEPQLDSIHIYYLASSKYVQKFQIGKMESHDQIM